VSETWAVSLALSAKEQGLYEQTLEQMRDLLAETNQSGGDGGLDPQYDAADVRRLLNHFLMLERNLLTADVAEAQAELEDITTWHDEAEDETERRQLELLMAMSERKVHEAIEQAIQAAGCMPLTERIMARLVLDNVIRAGTATDAPQG
jgi:type VI protein secretion system component VasA